MHAAGYKYPNVTLTTDALRAVVFLPGERDAAAYYRASRFDHGTMIGDLQFKGEKLFGSNYWRGDPHDPEWTESGVGLASEWGCGEDGHLCGPGWLDSPDNDSSNGVLGYASAKLGEPFLKIGVGLLIKGSCLSCVPNDETYRFNSPYKFSARPQWIVRRLTPSAVAMQHSASLGGYAYQLERTVQLTPDARLQVQTTLRNRGSLAFRTPYYSHNLLSVDDLPTGLGIRLALDVNQSAYTDSLPWAAPLENFFEREASDRDDTMRPVSSQMLRATRPVSSPTRIKAIYSGSAAASSSGSWAVEFKQQRLAVTSTLGGPLPLYAYNLYIEDRTLSPEPIQMVALEPGQERVLTQTLQLQQLYQRQGQGAGGYGPDGAAAGSETNANLEGSTRSPSSTSSRMRAQWKAAKQQRGFVRVQTRAQ